MRLIRRHQDAGAPWFGSWRGERSTWCLSTSPSGAKQARPGGPASAWEAVARMDPYAGARAVVPVEASRPCAGLFFGEQIIRHARSLGGLFRASDVNRREAAR